MVTPRGWGFRVFARTIRVPGGVSEAGVQRGRTLRGRSPEPAAGLVGLGLGLGCGDSQRFRNALCDSQRFRNALFVWSAEEKGAVRLQVSSPRCRRSVTRPGLGWASYSIDLPRGMCMYGISTVRVGPLVPAAPLGRAGETAPEGLDYCLSAPVHLIWDEMGTCPNEQFVPARSSLAGPQPM